MKNTVLIVMIALPATSVGQDLSSTLTDLAEDLEGIQAELEAIERTNLELVAAESGFAIAATEDSVPVYSGADVATDKIYEAMEGMNFRVINQANDWYAVQLPQAGSNGMTTGWMNAASGVPNIITPETPDPSLRDRLLQNMMERVQAMREKYENNPHIQVSGFNVEIGISPSLSIGFSFKE